MPKFITTADAAGKLTWSGVSQAMADGHRRAKAQVGDVFLGDSNATLLSRAAHIEALGFGVKSVTVVPDNAARGLPTIHGAMIVFAPDTGTVDAIVDSDLVTAWKTAGDSVLGAKLLARPDSRRLLIVGAGVVAANLVEAYREVFPGLEHIEIYNRSRERAQALVARLGDAGVAANVVTDRADAAARADIVATATMSREPVLFGDWIGPGTHVDLIGAFKADMREADDNLLRKARVFVDSRDTTMHHIGELKIPLNAGVISQDDVIGDFYDLVAGRSGRQSEDEITVFKNGGGAHLDLMTARYIIAAVSS